MKKIYVALLAMIMVLAFAAVSMAAPAMPAASYEGQMYMEWANTAGTYGDWLVSWDMALKWDFTYAIGDKGTVWAALKMGTNSYNVDMHFQNKGFGFQYIMNDMFTFQAYKADKGFKGEKDQFKDTFGPDVIYYTWGGVLDLSGADLWMTNQGGSAEFKSLGQGVKLNDNNNEKFKVKANLSEEFQAAYTAYIDGGLWLAKLYYTNGENFKGALAYSNSTAGAVNFNVWGEYKTDSDLLFVEFGTNTASSASQYMIVYSHATDNMIFSGKFANDNILWVKGIYAIDDENYYEAGIKYQTNGDGITGAYALYTTGPWGFKAQWMKVGFNWVNWTEGFAVAARYAFTGATDLEVFWNPAKQIINAHVFVKFY